MFEWDADKATSNLTKHGISFDEAATVFEDPLAITVVDTKNSKREHRLTTIGFSNASRLLLVVNTERNENIRIISARKLIPAERKLYESQR